MNKEDKYYWTEIYYIFWSLISVGILSVFFNFLIALTWSFLFLILVELIKTNRILMQIKELKGNKK